MVMPNDNRPPPTPKEVVTLLSAASRLPPGKLRRLIDAVRSAAAR
jgi:hypothetical protein